MSRFFTLALDGFVPSAFVLVVLPLLELVFFPRELLFFSMLRAILLAVGALQ